ncbi:hypothetical protein V7R84_01925 [Arachnia propionica]|uniref:hypothetical protein n=1 Tax=Arachnia propionica TaxID=1750 RepID=UPI0030CF3D2D
MFGGPGLISRLAESLHMVGGPGTGIGRPSKGTCITMLVHDHDVTIINTHTGQIIRELTIDPTRDYQPHRPKQRSLNLQNEGSGHANVPRHHKVGLTGFEPATP